MTDKEKMKEFENWLKGQKKEFDERCERANEGNMRAYVEAITGAVLLLVLNKFNEIERR